jgi:hypothetical protein
MKTVSNLTHRSSQVGTGDRSALFHIPYIGKVIIKISLEFPKDLLGEFKEEAVCV